MKIYCTEVQYLAVSLTLFKVLIENKKAVPNGTAFNLEKTE